MMKLDDLLSNDSDAAELFASLTPEAQRSIRRTGEDIGSLAALRDRTIHLVHSEGPFYNGNGYDGTPLEPEEKAKWVRFHQA